MRRICWVFVFSVLLAALPLFAGVAPAAEGSARAAYVMDLTTGRVLYAQSEHEPLPMASTTKVMTALLALENGDLDALVTTGPNAYGRPGTSIYLDRGETLTLEAMLYGLLIASGNDAAVAIAEHISGSVEDFCERMTARARELGATDTRFLNPHGLPADGHVTTARDLSLIAAQAMKNPIFREIVTTERASIPWEGRSYMRILKNKNALLQSYEGVTGIKTGFTRAAGRCLVFGARRGELELVGTVLGCPDWFSEAADIMDHVFATYAWTEMLPDGERVGNVTILGGELETLPVLLKGPLAGPVSELEQPLMRIEIVESIHAPQPAGAQVGFATMFIGEQVIAQQPLVIAEPARQAPSPLLRWLRGWTLLRGASPYEGM